jgi:cation diffusion facilitator family transporter
MSGSMPARTMTGDAAPRGAAAFAAVAPGHRHVGMDGNSSRASARRARQSSDRSLERSRGGGESRKTILVALAANALIAVAKLAGGMISGSTALLAEAAHSVADTTNQAFLLVSVHLSGRPPDADQPFGHGQERFLWSFMAAIGMFLAGAVFAIGYGAYELVKGPEEPGGFGIAWATLAIALAAEGTSWVRAMRQARGEAREAGKPVLRHARESRDPSVKLVLFEDSAALVGIAIAALGIGLGELTGEGAFDPAASILIGVLLVAVAIWMARDTSHLLVGAAALPEERRRIEDVIEAHADVVEVQELLTMALGPNALLVAARVDLRDDIDARTVEGTATELDRAVREAVPDVTEVFLDATPPGDGGSDR